MPTKTGVEGQFAQERRGSDWAGPEPSGPTAVLLVELRGPDLNRHRLLRHHLHRVGHAGTTLNIIYRLTLARPDPSRRS